MSDETRRKYIEVAYGLLTECGYENISIRRIAKEMGCNSATLYKYFDNLNHLLAMASFRYLFPYYDAYDAVLNSCTSPIDASVQGWECFAYYAFKDIPVYNNLFFGEGISMVEIAKDYAMEFPEEKDRISTTLLPYFEMGDLIERDLVTLLRVVEYGAMTEEGARHLAICDVMTLRGFFHMHGNKSIDGETLNKTLSAYLETLYRNYRNELLAGYRINIPSPSERRNLYPQA